MPDDQKPANNLIDLGPGEGSKVERIKIESNHLRGQIAEELDQDTTHFSEAQIQLLKFHGTYQQENRDARKERKAQGEEKHTSSWYARVFRRRAECRTVPGRG